MRRDVCGRRAAGSSRLYFVRMDISKAFDNIAHDKLLDVVHSVLRHDEYHSGCGLTVTALLNW